MHGFGAVIVHAGVKKCDPQSRRHELTNFIIFLLEPINSFLQNKMQPRRAYRSDPPAHRERRASPRRARLHARGAHSPCTRTSSVHLVTSATSSNIKA